MENKIYKICSKNEWIDAKKLGIFKGYGIDVQDGFIHFSSKKQVKETARLHFDKKVNLVLLEIDSNLLNIKWEKSRNGELFPHLYDNLPINSILEVYDLKLDTNNNHVFPSHLDSNL